MMKHILLVDDEPAILFTLAFVLRTHGYKVSQARDGHEALEVLETAEHQGNPLDLIITDIQMPVMNGIELINSLKEKGLTVPVFVLTGTRDMELMNRLMKKGCYGFMFKPCDFREIANTVEVLLKVESTTFVRKRRAAGFTVGLEATL